LIYALALKSGLSESEAEEVVQETVITVARDIHKFKRDSTLGSFKGWLRKTIRWRIADQYRKRPNCGNPGGEPGGTAPDLSEIPDPGDNGLELAWQEEWRKNLFDAAVERVKRRVKEEHYQIFDLYVIKGWSVSKVARSMRGSVGKVYLIKHRISLLIKKEIALLEHALF